MKNKLQLHPCWGLLVLLAFAQYSCKTSYEVEQIKAKALSDAKLYNTIIDSSLNYNTLFVKRFSASYSDNKEKKSFKGSIKIKKDSLIWISITAPVGGMEVIRLMIEKDSIKVIDRLKKKYLLTSYDFLKEKLHVDFKFETIQAIITNSLFETINDERDKAFIRSFNARIIDNEYVFTSEKSRKIDRKIRKEKLEKLVGFSYQKIHIDPALMRIKDIFVKDFDELRNISISYRNFSDFGGQKFPRNLNFKAIDRTHSLFCKVKFNRLSFDDDLKFSFKISDKYERINP